MENRDRRDRTNNTGELERINYSDSTPDVDFDTYDRMGRLTQVTGAVGTRTFSFDGDLNPDKEIINSSGDPQLYYRQITREYEPEPAVWVTTGFVVGRPQKIQVGVSGDVARDYETENFYDTGNARFNRVKGPGMPSYRYFEKKLTGEPKTRLARSGARYSVGRGASRRAHAAQGDRDRRRRRAAFSKSSANWMRLGSQSCISGH